MFMTTKILKGYTAVIIATLAFAVIGITFAYASEVTGTLSSNATGASLSGGSLAGTVSSDSGGSSGGGSRSGGGGGSNNSNSPTGAVLGASTDNVAAPAFPNAGFAPQRVN